MNYQLGAPDIELRSDNQHFWRRYWGSNWIFESMANQMEGFNTTLKNHQSFNKMIETQVPQLAASCPNPNKGKLPGQPEVPPKESVSAVTTRDPPMP